MESTTADIWLSQGGEKWGPYSEAVVRQWLTEGRFTSDVLAWREGSAGWAPLATLLGGAAAPVPPPIARVPPTPPPSMTPPPPHQEQSAFYEAPIPTHDSIAKRTALPRPPSLHWSLLLLFTLLSLGIFGFVWVFIQAGWVRKIDKHSNAAWLLAGWVVCTILAVILAWVPMLRGEPSIGMSSLSLLLNLAGVVLLVVAYFSMANSVRREVPKYGARVAIGGLTLFFFTYLYFQGQLRWLYRWRSGDKHIGSPPKAIFWVLMSLFFLSSILLAIALPAYQAYAERSAANASQVAQEQDSASGSVSPNVGMDYETPANSDGRSNSTQDSALDAAQAAAAAEIAAATSSPTDEEQSSTLNVEGGVTDPYVIYRAEQEAKRVAEMETARGRLDWIATCAERSRTLATPAGNEVGLDAQEATQYCTCLHDDRPESGSQAQEGICLDRLMQSD